jgi:ComF family protein
MLEPFLGLFLKSPCPLCQRPRNREICGDCERRLQDYRYPNPLVFWRGDLPLFVWGRYEGQLKRAIAVMKYDRHPDLGRVAGRWLAESWRTCTPLPSNRYQVIPIPLHRQRLQERGFNQAEAIAKGFCHFTGYSLRAEGLLRVRATEALFGLSPAERQQTMRSAFQVGKSLDLGRSILLLDDIYTTGTTVQEAAKVLREKGYTVAGAIALSSSKTS